MTKMFTEKGSTMDELIRSSLESFSDNELKALSQVLGDPSFRKFQAAMSGPAAERIVLACHRGARGLTCIKRDATFMQCSGS